MTEMAHDQKKWWIKMKQTNNNENEAQAEEKQRIIDEARKELTEVGEKNAITVIFKRKVKTMKNFLHTITLTFTPSIESYFLSLERVIVSNQYESQNWQYGAQP